MITAWESTQQFCIDKNMPAPSQNDLKHIGRILSAKFKTLVCASPQYQLGHVTGMGFAKTKERGSIVVVVYYPDFFRDQAILIIDNFYRNKAAGVVSKMHGKLNKPFGASNAPTQGQSEGGKKMRKKIPIDGRLKPAPVKVASSADYIKKPE